MKVPIQFPSEDDVIRADVARHQALTPAERYRSIRSLLNSGFHLMRFSPNPRALEDYTREQEELAKQAFLELVRRHGHGR